MSDKRRNVINVAVANTPPAALLTAKRNARWMGGVEAASIVHQHDPVLRVSSPAFRLQHKVQHVKSRIGDTRQGSYGKLEVLTVKLTTGHGTGRYSMVPYSWQWNKAPAQGKEAAWFPKPRMPSANSAPCLTVVPYLGYNSMSSWTRSMVSGVAFVCGPSRALCLQCMATKHV